MARGPKLHVWHIPPGDDGKEAVAELMELMRRHYQPRKRSRALIALWLIALTLLTLLAIAAPRMAFINRATRLEQVGR